MKKVIPTVCTVLAVSLAFQSCTQKTDADGQSENSLTESRMETMEGVPQNAGKAAEEAKDAAKLAVVAAKLAVCSAAQKDKEAAAQMARKADTAAQLAHENIIAANAEIDVAVNENARKVEELAKKAVAATGDAAPKTEASIETGIQSDSDAAKKAALSAQKSRDQGLRGNGRYKSGCGNRREANMGKRNELI